MSVGKLQLFSSWFCPFAQRAWIALVEKQLLFDLHEIDPYNKTPEFLAINPRGLVPVIMQPDGRSVFESYVCIEYADELKPDFKPLLPKDTWERAHVRTWCDYISKRIVPLFYKLLMNQEAEETKSLRDTYLANIATLSSAVHNEGPYFMGPELGIVDIMVIPFLLRTELVLNAYTDTQLPNTMDFEKIKRLLNAGMQHPSVIATLADEDRLLAKYKRYADDSAKTEVADAIRKGTVFP